MTFVALICALASGALAAVAWRRVVARLERRPLLECALGIVGFAATASAATGLLYLAWSGELVPPPGVPALDHPFFSAALAGTVAGHLAVLGWAWGLGAPLAVVTAPPRWWLLGGITGLACIAVSLAWATAADRLGFSLEEQGLVSSVLDAPPSALRTTALLFVVVGAPVLEELVFRGFIQGSVASAVGARAGIVVSAVLFGGFHVADPSTVPVLVVIGAILAWLRARSGSVMPAMVGHVVNNGTALLVASW